MGGPGCRAPDEAPLRDALAAQEIAAWTADPAPLELARAADTALDSEAAQSPASAV